MDKVKQTILKVAAMLAVFAITATTLVALTENVTHEQIAINERNALLKAINTLIPHEAYDNQILEDTLQLAATATLGTKEATTIYRARKAGQPVAVVLTAIAPNGYSGSIKMLVGIYNDGRIAGVRVINHQETPGLGDKIDSNKTNWILSFDGLSLENPTPSQWKVKKDGGQFDQFTGATITPRAVVAAVKNALDYFQANRDALFTSVENKS
jgi:electron transport complex protein RnfG